MGNCFCNRLNQENNSNQHFQIEKSKTTNKKKTQQENSYFKYFKIFNHKEINKLGINHCSIPNDPYDRLKWVYEFYKSNKVLEDYIQRAPERNSSELSDLVEYLKKYPSKDILTKYFLVYLWITKNISYDINSFRLSKSLDFSTAEIFSSGVSNWKGYSKLFDKICKDLKLFSICITGFKKLSNSFLPLITSVNKAAISSNENNNNLKIEDNFIYEEANHEWNVIDINCKFYFVDSNLGSGYVNEKDEFCFNFNPLYFLTPAEFLIDDHFPLKSEWQLLNKEITKTQFESQRYFKIIDNYNEIFKRNVDLLTESLPVIFFDGNENDNTNLNEINLKINYPKKEIVVMLKLKYPSNFNNNNHTSTISSNKNLNSFNYNSNYNQMASTLGNNFNFENLVFIEKQLLTKEERNVFDIIDDKNYNKASEKENNDIYDVNVLIPFDGVFSLNFFELDISSEINKNINYRKSFEYNIDAKNIKKQNYIGFPIQHMNENKLNYNLISPKTFYLKKNSFTHFSIILIEDVSEIIVSQGNLNENLCYSNGLWEKTIKINEEEINLLVKIDRKSSAYTKLYTFNSC